MQTISLIATQGGTQVVGQVHIIDTGGGTLSFTATAISSGGSWLSVSPASGMAALSSPATLTVIVSIGTLAAGTYSGEVVVTGAGSAVTLPVALILYPAPAAAVLVSQSAARRRESTC